MVKNVWTKQIERTETLTRYLDDIKKFDIISADEEVELIERAQNGDENAFGKLMNCHQRYIF
jgi:DNA-directed RNA polymerase sigma subunit (sigma70/sigma32)